MSISSLRIILRRGIEKNRVALEVDKLYQLTDVDSFLPAAFMRCIYVRHSGFMLMMLMESY